MVFRSASELERQIDSMVNHATALLEMKIKTIVEKSIIEFYGEWKPDYYLRTYQLFKSLIHSNVSKTSNGYTANVYLDFSKMNHDMGRIKGGGTKPNKHLSEERIGEIAASGSKPHGNWQEGTTIWDDPLSELSTEKYEIIKEMLIEAGIPIR